MASFGRKHGDVSATVSACQTNATHIPFNSRGNQRWFSGLAIKQGLKQPLYYMPSHHPIPKSWTSIVCSGKWWSVVTIWICPKMSPPLHHLTSIMLDDPFPYVPHISIFFLRKIPFWYRRTPHGEPELVPRAPNTAWGKAAGQCLWPRVSQWVSHLSNLPHLSNCLMSNLTNPIHPTAYELLPSCMSQSSAMLKTQKNTGRIQWDGRKILQQLGQNVAACQHHLLPWRFATSTFGDKTARVKTFHP